MSIKLPEDFFDSNEIMDFLHTPGNLINIDDNLLNKKDLHELLQNDNDTVVTHTGKFVTHETKKTIVDILQNPPIKRLLTEGTYEDSLKAITKWREIYETIKEKYKKNPSSFIEYADHKVIDKIIATLTISISTYDPNTSQLDHKYVREIQSQVMALLSDVGKFLVPFFNTEEKIVAEGTLYFG